MSWEFIYRHLVAAGYDLLIVWTLVLMAACAAAFRNELWPHASAPDQVTPGKYRSPCNR